MARAAVESLVRQVASLNRAQHAAAADASRRAAAADAAGAEADAALAAAGAEAGALRAALAEAREAAAEGERELRRWVSEQLAAHRAAVDEAVQVRGRCAKATAGGALWLWTAPPRARGTAASVARTDRRAPFGGRQPHTRHPPLPSISRHYPPQHTLQSATREARAEAGAARADLAAASAAGLRQLEAWARGEMLAVTGKLKHVTASCAAQQEQVGVGRDGRGGASAVGLVRMGVCRRVRVCQLHGGPASRVHRSQTSKQPHNPISPPILHARHGCSLRRCSSSGRARRRRRTPRRPRRGGSSAMLQSWSGRPKWARLDARACVCACVGA